MMNVFEQRVFRIETIAAQVDCKHCFRLHIEVMQNMNEKSRTIQKRHTRCAENL